VVLKKKKTSLSILQESAPDKRRQLHYFVKRAPAGFAKQRDVKFLKSELF